MFKQRDSQRWDLANSFGKSSWSSRNVSMLQLFDQQVPDAMACSFSEYGCGPHAPFAQAVAAKSQRTVIKYDRKDWGTGNFVADFNAQDVKISTSDTGVLSGVLEYVNDIEATLRLLQSHHRYLLVSYAHLPFKCLKTEKAYIERVLQRAEVDGWRNHLSLDGIFNMVSKFGFIDKVDFWKSQVIFVVKLHK